MSSLPNGISDTILNNAGSYGGSIQIADFCPYVQVLCVYMYTVDYGILLSTTSVVNFKV